ncbi:MAG: hypothetical protein PQJ46_09545 [Spirochaetales bacterium]|nr:hypothetical protein [Spirochaetales bacterium]
MKKITFFILILLLVSSVCVFAGGKSGSGLSIDVGAGLSSGFLSSDNGSSTYELDNILTIFATLRGALQI